MRSPGEARHSIGRLNPAIVRHDQAKGVVKPKGGSEIVVEATAATETGANTMFSKSDDTILKDGPHTLGETQISSPRVRQRSLLATLGIGAGVAASLVVGLGSPAHADNPSPGLLAKIQIATQAFQGTPNSRAMRTAPRNVGTRPSRGRR